MPILQLEGSDNGPKVAIVVIGKSDRAAETVSAINRNTSYRYFTIEVLPESRSTAETINRFARGRAEELILILKAGMKPTDPKWLSRMVAYQQLPGVGAVSGLIRHEDSRVISAGTVLGMKDGLGPDAAFAGLSAEAISYYFFAESSRNVAAADGRCLLTSRQTFERVNGFDAKRFGTTLWDVDYGLRLAAAGLRSVHAGGVEFRSNDPIVPRSDDPGERKSFKDVYARPVDPYYNPNLSEWETFRPRIDAPLLIQAEARTPPVKTLVATHNLNNREGAPRYLSEICMGMKRRGVWQPTMFSPFPWSGEQGYA